MAEEIKNITVSMSELQDMMKKTYSRSDELRSAFDKMVRESKKLADAYRNNTKDVEKYKKTLALAKAELKDTAKATEEANKALRESQKEWENSTKGAKKYWEGLKAVGGGLSTAASGITKYTGLLGAQAFSLDNMNKRTLAYNKSMFQFSRTQQVAGRGMGDMGNALKSVRANTVLSDNAFLDMADSVSKLFIGVRPTATEMADMAKMLQSQFGPNVDVITEKFKNLAQIQSQFPSLYKRIKDAMGLVAKAKSGDQVAKKELEMEQERIRIASINQGMRGEALAEVLKGITVTTDAEDKQMALQKAQAELEKKSANAVLDSGKAIEGSMINAAKAAGQLYGWLDKMAPAAGAAALSFAALDIAMSFGAALRGLKSAMGLFNIGAKAAGGLATSVTAAGTAAETTAASAGRMGIAFKGAGVLGGAAIAGLIGYGIGTKIDEWTGLSEKFGASMAKWDITKKLSGVSENSIYTEEMAAVDKAAKAARLAMEKDTKQPKTLAGTYEEVVSEMEAQLALVGQVNQAMQEQVSISESFGLVNKDAWNNYIASAKKAQKETEMATTGILEDTLDRLKTLEIPISLKTDASAQEKLTSTIKQLSSQRDNLLKKGKLEEKEDKKLADINAFLLTLSKQQTTSAQRQADVVNTTIRSKMAEVKQMEDVTSLSERRLATERQLMESAQFGLGASVEMMQKQVNLANKMAKTYNETDANIKTAVADQYKLNNAQRSQLDNILEMSTAEEAQASINKLAGEGTDKAKALMEVYKQHLILKTKEMQQQQKIYDLTKNIREGYLDALREMSVGAGEFEKIIGTQEMGVTQLMDAVKDATGEYKTNTFKLGGKQGSASTAAGTRTQVTGQMTTQGLKFIGGAEQEARNRGIWQYKSSTSNVAGIKGGAVGTVAPRVGSAVAPQYQEVYAPSQRDAFAQIGGAGYVSPTSTPMSVVNRGVFAGGLNVGETKTIQGGVPAGVLGSNILNMQPPPMPATGGFVPGIGIMPQPSQATVIVKLESGLKGELEQVSNLKVQLDRASR